MPVVGISEFLSDTRSGRFCFRKASTGKNNVLRKYFHSRPVSYGRFVGLNVYSIFYGNMFGRGFSIIHNGELYRYVFVSNRFLDELQIYNGQPRSLVESYLLLNRRYIALGQTDLLARATAVVSRISFGGCGLGLEKFCLILHLNVLPMEYMQRPSSYNETSQSYDKSADSNPNSPPLSPFKFGTFKQFYRYCFATLFSIIGTAVFMLGAAVLFGLGRVNRWLTALYFRCGEGVLLPSMLLLSEDLSAGVVSLCPLCSFSKRLSHCGADYAAGS
jgi:hypothetical protein